MDIDKRIDSFFFFRCRSNQYNKRGNSHIILHKSVDSRATLRCQDLFGYLGVSCRSNLI